MGSKMQSVNSVFDTDAALNLIREVFLRVEWLSAIRAKYRSAFRDTARQTVSVVRTIRLQVEMGESRVRVVFGVVSTSTVPVVLWIYFTNRFVKVIFTLKWNMVRYNSKLVLILPITGVPERPKDNEKDNDKDKQKKKTKEQGQATCQKPQTTRYDGYERVWPTTGPRRVANEDRAKVIKKHSTRHRRESVSTNKTASIIG